MSIMGEINCGVASFKKTSYNDIAKDIVKRVQDPASSKERIVKDNSNSNISAGDFNK